MPVELDDTLDSSASAPQPEDQGTAAPDTETSSPPSPPSGQDTQPSTSDAPSTAQAAIDFLTKTPPPAEDAPAAKPDADPKATKPDATKAADDKAKPKDPPKPATDAKPDETPLTPEERKQFGPKAQKRIVELHSRAKTAETKFAELEKTYQAAAPDVAFGKAFSGVIEQYSLQADLGDLNPESGDADVAAAIKFSASVQRALAGKATPADQQFITAAVEHASGLARQLGYAQAPAPAIDAAAFKDALDKAENEFDYTALRELAKKLEESPNATQPQPKPQPAVPPAPPMPTQSPRAPAPAPVEPDPDTTLYSAKLVRAIKETGISSAADVEAYYKGTIYPAVRAHIAKEYQVQNPDAFYAKASAAMRYELCETALRDVQKQAQAAKPKPQSVATNNPRPVASTGTTRPGSGPAATGVKAAIEFLTQG
jgi:hypothetical protein